MLDAIAVIQMEQKSCVRVERFEFYQKMVLLECWLALMEGRAVNNSVYEAHKAKFDKEHSGFN